ncbi:hypothetical protein TSH58p_22545 (plasmid) [Azospirillum sp. TSH58]|uniref:hypothetical protein n=1 Tax=Azospirillum sp. TSH58 TaxID=664962 RepID=UPI000D5FE6F3|nr:hypothetical protein [Azospirillum sp. TSH58]AWJ86303.1 hypothetical protein TSH58p_22545 [Azospirillum sp. TSH58]PWC57885.1 hypothetical protein TSH58_30920 [Azospirillum sp. TSH58]
MTAKRSDLAGLPFWPRMLSREQAAAYLGVSDRMFDQEVAAGIWPRGIPRGTGKRLTWDRHLIDRFADALSGLDEGGAYEDDLAIRREARNRRRANKAVR